MRGAVQARYDAFDTKAHCRSVARAEVIRWLGAYRRSHKDLERKFYLDPRRVESYFKRATNGKRDDGSGEDTAAAEQPPGGIVEVFAPGVGSAAGSRR